MEILIVRHGHAVDSAPGLGDGGRWLTGKGREVTRRVAKWLVKSKDRRPAAIWTSPLVRAVQTAEIIAEAAALTDEVSVVAELSPGRAPADLVRLLSMYHGATPLALVGHEPSLSALAASLLGDAAAGSGKASGDIEPLLRLKKGGVVAVTWDGRGPASFRFLLDPKEMGVTVDLQAARKDK